MIIRIGKVTNVYPTIGRVKVLFEDTGNTSVKLPMLTLNNEYKMPVVGSYVITVHLQNGSSKGFVLGTYWSDVNVPAEAGVGVYRKDMGGGVYARSLNGTYRLQASNIQLVASAGAITVEMLVAALDRITKLEEKISSLEAATDDSTETGGSE
ncbi:MAG: hypothetical protein IJV71_02580 [Lachnospiraceae bacterium]|nr:hypothetical protein [Lachnospiraceae bacterium]